VDPAPGAVTAIAEVEPISEAENPGMVPATLLTANKLAVPYANGIAVTPDAKQAWASLLQNGGLIELTLPVLSPTIAMAYPIAATTPFTNVGINGGSVAVDPRGNYVYTVEWDITNTYPYIVITTTAAPDPPLSPTSLVGALPHGANSCGTLRVCQAGGSPTAITVSPDGNRLFIACQHDPNDTVEVWNVVQADGVRVGSDTLLLSPIRTIDLPASVTPAAPTVYPLETGCTTPVDIKANMTTNTYGTRFYVTCYN
jgi:DNA-binding beta-propeller fold protein YncE